jgi:hypothetical protein
MSIFNKIFDAHVREKNQREQEEAAKAAAEKAATNEFIAAFKLHLEFVAAPIFEGFVKDAKSHGFPAKTEFDTDAANNMIYTLAFAALPGTELGAHPQSECACVIKGMLAERKVELASHFDKRPGRRVGVKSEVFALPVVTAVVLERVLGELLSSALEASVN